MPGADAVGEGRPSFGFGPADKAGCPSPPSTARYAVDQQDGVEGSTLELYRSLLEYRRRAPARHGGLALVEGFADDVVALGNSAREGEHTPLVVANLGAEPVALPDGDGAGRLGSPDRRGAVPEDTTVWATRCRRLSRHTGL